MMLSDVRSNVGALLVESALEDSEAVGSEDDGWMDSMLDVEEPGLFELHPAKRTVNAISDNNFFIYRFPPLILYRKHL